MLELGKIVYSLRMEQGLSQRQLAKIADVSNDYISKIEMGSVENIGVLTLNKIAVALDVDPLELQKRSYGYVYGKKGKKKSSKVKEPKLSYVSKLDAQTRILIKHWSKLTPDNKKIVVSLVKNLK